MPAKRCRAGNILTDVTADPLGLTEDLEDATARLLRTAGGLTDATAASRLPGWTVGHVLTHIARNADGLTNLLTWARTSEVTPQYASVEARAADIDAGAPRPLRDQLDDLTAACERFAAAADAMPPEAWTHLVQPTVGPEMPAAQVMWSRLREVEIHHVDLGAGYGPADWPAAFALRMVHVLVKDMSERSDAPRVVLRIPEIGHDLPLGAPALDSSTDPTPAQPSASPSASPPASSSASPSASSSNESVVSGPAWAVVAWLIGRSAGDQLTGTLPPVPTWR
jgi:maleylpyruvate isomerase